MKKMLVILYLFLSTSFNHPSREIPGIINSSPDSGNLFIILIDGYRWQEIFKGADSILINNENMTPDATTLKSMYWADSFEERRKRLMPFFWNVIAKNGQLLGNRELGNKVNVSNIYSVSYPGYNEIFTGTSDLSISGNSKKRNPNINVLEYLNSREDFEGKIAVFSSWDVFPYILNRDRNNLLINSGYEQIDSKIDFDKLNMIKLVQEKGIENKSATRYDMLTYMMAKEYIKKHKPSVVVIGFGETDEVAHEKRYDLYLERANQVDRMIGELWHLIQTTQGYKNNTNLIIATDHGRGNNAKHWSGHSFFINGSSQTWLAMIGPDIKPSGERKEKGQFYNKELATIIAKLAGEEFFSLPMSPQLTHMIRR